MNFKVKLTLAAIAVFVLGLVYASSARAGEPGPLSADDMKYEQDVTFQYICLEPGPLEFTLDNWTNIPTLGIPQGCMLFPQPVRLLAEGQVAEYRYYDDEGDTSVIMSVLLPNGGTVWFHRLIADEAL